MDFTAETEEARKLDRITNAIIGLARNAGI